MENISHSIGSFSFSELSRRSHQYLKDGDYQMYQSVLREMEWALRDEQRYIDAAKVRMIAFHIGLSGMYGPPKPDINDVCAIHSDIVKAKMARHEWVQLYLDAIGPGVTPVNIVSARDGAEILGMFFDGEWREAQQACRNFSCSDNLV